MAPSNCNGDTIMNTTSPYSFYGKSGTLLQIFGMGPMFNITCGKCKASFSKRVPIVDNPGLKCPTCGAINILPLVVKSDPNERDE